MRGYHAVVQPDAVVGVAGEDEDGRAGFGGGDGFEWTQKPRPLRLNMNDFHRQYFSHWMVGGDECADFVQSCSVEIPFTALHANLRIHILDDVQLSLKPVLLTYFFRPGL